MGDEGCVEEAIGRAPKELDRLSGLGGVGGCLATELYVNGVFVLMGGVVTDVPPLSSFDEATGIGVGFCDEA